jgi:NADPH:quinone reductase
MRAVVHHEFGDPSAVLAVEDVPAPEPGAGQVRVRTVLSPIHQHDLLTVRGEYGVVPDLPARAGTEAVGVVDALGDGVDRLRVGQRVTTAGTLGAWAEHLVIDAAGLVPVPDGMPDETAAQLVAMPLSTLALLDQLQLEPGDWVVHNAANGAVGRMLAQFAAARGVRTLGLVRRDEGIGELAAQGIHDVVSTASDDWADQVRAITGRARIRAGIDSVGGRASRQLISLLADDGELVSFGVMASPVLEAGVADLLFRRVTVRGYWGSHALAVLPDERRSALMAEMLQRIQDGTVTLPVADTFALADLQGALAATGESGRTGKVLLRP